MKKIPEIRDIIAEQEMQKLGISFSVQLMPLNKIDIAKGLHNQARLSRPIDPETLERYVMGFKNGDAFPMPVLFTNGTKPCYAAGGNTRLKMYTETLDQTQEIPCYIVEKPDPMIEDVLPRILNRAHGRPTDRKDLFIHAAHVIRDYSLSSQKTASMFGLSVTSLNQHLAALACATRISKHHLDPSILNDTLLTRLNSIKNEHAFAAAAALLVRNRKVLQGKEANEIITNVNNATTEAQQIAVIADCEKELCSETSPVIKIPRAIRTRFLMVLGNLESVLKGKKTLKQLQITNDEETTKCKIRIAALSKVLRALS